MNEICNLNIQIESKILEFMNYKILFSIFFTIIIVSVIFGTSMSVYINNYDPDWYGLLSSNNFNEDNKKRIFLIGSSTIYPIDAKYVNQQLSLNDIDYELFNLADMSDSPKKRLQSLSNIISHKPDIIIYGLDMKNFRINTDSNDSFSEMLLNPKIIFENQFIDLITPIQDNIPGSPKDRTLLTLKYFLFGPQPHHHPFINFYETSITPIKDLKEELDDSQKSARLDLSDYNEQIISLKKIISESKKNNIKLIFFSTPYLQTSVTESNIHNFEKMLEEYSKNDISAYFLHDKYAEMEIWRDGIHIAINKDTQIYSKDILEILLKEINIHAV